MVVGPGGRMHLLSIIGTIPIRGEYWPDSLSIVCDENCAVLIAWLENRHASSALMLACFENFNGPIIIHDLGHGVSGVALTKLQPGAFAVVKCCRNLTEVNILQKDGKLSDSYPIGHGLGAGLSALTMFNGALGIVANSALLVHVPESQHTYIAATYADVWQSASAALPSGDIIHVTSGTNDAYMHPPRYRIRGYRYASDLAHLGEFSLLLPSEIIGDTYAHPQDLFVLPLASSMFVVAWTLLSHHKGNRVQLQLFDQTGQPLGVIVTVAPSVPSSHIAAARLAQVNARSLLVGWTRSNDLLGRNELVNYDINTAVVTMKHRTDWRSQAGGIAVSADYNENVWILEAVAGHIVIYDRLRR